MSPTRAAGFVFPPHLSGLDRFEPGKPIGEVQRELGLRDVVKLASNENPLGPSPLAVEAAHAVLGQVNRYADPQATELRQALARRLEVPVEQILTGNGSVEIIELAARALLGPGDNAVISEHAFVRFRQIVDAHNRGARIVPMRDLTHDLAAMAAAIDARTRLVFVANPNNPTGTWNRKAELEALVAALPSNCLLLLDEAYFEYADDPDYPNGIELRAPRRAGDRDAHVLEGLRPRGASSRLRDRGARGARRAPRDPRGVRHEPGGAGGGRGRARRRGARAPLAGAEPHREGAARGGAREARLPRAAEPHQLPGLRHPPRPAATSSRSCWRTA